MHNKNSDSHIYFVTKEIVYKTLRLNLSLLARSLTRTYIGLYFGVRVCDSVLRSSLNIKTRYRLQNTADHSGSCGFQALRSRLVMVSQSHLESTMTGKYERWPISTATFADLIKCKCYHPLLPGRILFGRRLIFLFQFS